MTKLEIYEQALKEIADLKILSLESELLVAIAKRALREGRDKTNFLNLEGDLSGIYAWEDSFE